MKNSIIIKNIRRTLAKQLLFPVLLLIFSLAVLYKTPKDNFFNPRPLNSKSNYENFYNRDLPHVTVSVPRLTYSGLDYVVDGMVRGHYYYTLSDGLCQFYVLSKEAKTPPALELNSLNLRGRLIRFDDIEFEMILKNMAKNLDWTPSSLRNMSSSCAVSTLPYPIYSNLLFFAVLYGCILITIADILCTLFYIGKPLRAPALRCLGTLDGIRAALPRVELEMKHVSVAKAGGIYLTPGYFINMDALKTLILPLPSVVWIYYRTAAHPARRCSRRFYTLHVMTGDGRTHHFTKKKKEDLEYIVDILRFRNPELLAGYSKENKIKARRLL